MGSINKTFEVKTDLPGKHKFVCKECCRETTHLIVAQFSEEGSEAGGGGYTFDWTTRNQIIQCQGCESVSFRVTTINSEDYDHDPETNAVHYFETVKFYPGRSEGLKAINSYLLPENVRRIYQETVLAIESEQYVLAGIGVRALIETICKDLEVDGKDLYHKINSLKDKAIVTKEGVETLHKLRGLGNDAAHEVKQHNTAQLTLAIQVIEHMLDGTYIIPHNVAKTF